MKPIFAIDPGYTKSAYCVYHPDTHVVREFAKVDNDMLRAIITASTVWEYEYAVEMIASYGMPVGREVFETCLWVGRYQEIIHRYNKPFELIYRKDVKQHLCGNLKAKDSNIRQSIMDLFPATGGGKKPVIGTKAEPGPLYGVSNDVWAAVGVALTYHNKQKRLEAA